MKKLIGLVLLGGLGLFLLIQLVPYGRNHNNPPVTQEVQWTSVEAKQIAQRACYDCHSNETTWPWYTNIAPFSWLVQRDVDEGRQQLNFSEWGRGRQEMREIREVILEGGMPPAQYLVTHPQAALSASERQILVTDLLALGGQGTTKEGDDD